MNRLTDQELIDSLSEKLDFNRRALNDLREMTEKLEATNRKLQESEALKSHFLSNIRNEINNPLAAILGLATQFTGEVGGEKGALIARLIYAEAYALDFQLENIFVAAELEAGEARPSPALADAATIAAEVAGQMALQAEAKKISVRRGGLETLPFLSDPRMLQLMVRNLLANAIEFSPEGGVVEIDILADQEGLRIAVRDSGAGINPAEQEAVFDRFRQLDAGSTKSHRGHGLGLSITRSLAQLLGGSVLLESAPDAGSVFTLVLPELAADVEAVAPEGSFVLFGQMEWF
jgi:signal transduction histidine kinase